MWSKATNLTKTATWHCWGVVVYSKLDHIIVINRRTRRRSCQQGKLISTASRLFFVCPSDGCSSWKSMTLTRTVGISLHASAEAHDLLIGGPMF
uniref:Uncharacterized protein n=1 Tax=Aegilops tauschii subsp. strangulata TaxID=200361 RepID=A0A453SY37_AEGTS